MLYLMLRQLMLVSTLSDLWIDRRTATLKCGGWTTAVMALLEL